MQVIDKWFVYQDSLALIQANIHSHKPADDAHSKPTAPMARTDQRADGNHTPPLVVMIESQSLQLSKQQYDNNIQAEAPATSTSKKLPRLAPSEQTEQGSRTTMPERVGESHGSPFTSPSSIRSPTITYRTPTPASRVQRTLKLQPAVDHQQQSAVQQ